VANMKDQKPLRLKVISMGNAEVGKSCIIKRYCEKRFISKYLSTIGIDYGVAKVTLGDRDLKVNIFDMAGHPYFYEVRNEFYKDSQGAILVFDVTKRESFDFLSSWLDELRRDIGSQSDMDKIVIAVCANKIDKSTTRIVNESEGRLWAESNGFLYFETSALNGEGIQEMFQALFDAVKITVESGIRPSMSSSSLGYTKEQADAIKQLKQGKDNFERLGIRFGASSDEVNKAYKKLAVLLHPDKSTAPGTEEAFKILVNARSSLLHLQKGE